MNDLTVNILNFAAGDGVASRDQESVRPSADDLDCQGHCFSFFRFLGYNLCSYLL